MLISYLMLLWVADPGATVMTAPVPSPLQPAHVALLKDGRLLLLDTGDSVVYCTDPQGQELFRFGSSGQGPGAFQKPMGIEVTGDHIYVYEAVFGVSEFSLDGTFIQRVRPFGPDFGFSSWRRLSSGWSMFAPSTDPSKLGSAELYWRRTSEDRPRVIHEWSLELPMDQVLSDGRPTESRSYNPARDRWFAVCSLSARFQFIVPPGPVAKLIVFDSQTQELKEYPLDLPCVPFNEAWGEAFLEDMARPGVKLELLAPDFFPIVRNVYPVPHDRVALELWTTWPDRQQAFAFFDHAGVRINESDVNLGFVPEHLNRVIFGPEDFVAVLARNDEDDNIIMTCDPKEVNSMADKYPWQPDATPMFHSLR